MKLELRTESLRKVREAQMVPGVMYGKSIESTSIQADDKELKEALKTYGKSMTFKVRLDGKYHHVYIKNIQTTILKPHDIIHFDLHRVTEKESLTTLVPLVFTGKEAFHASTLYTQEEMSEVHAEYLPGHGISKIEVDVSKMTLGDVIRIKDLDQVEHVKINENPEKIIVSVKEVNIVEEEEPTVSESEVLDAFEKESESEQE